MNPRRDVVIDVGNLQESNDRSQRMNPRRDVVIDVGGEECVKYSVRLYKVYPLTGFTYNVRVYSGKETKNVLNTASDCIKCTPLQDSLTM
ncbi:hypothetical protein QE152_g29647 [Popillia japonica]|uniref:Uncharacterized protein n=1 Tax=Popillia japonica TaxID=7064 RepID=A0AAW1JGM1_POPJA